MKMHFIISIAICSLLGGCDNSAINQLVQGLPMCQQTEALKVVEQIVNGLPLLKAAEVTFVTLKDVREQGYNKELEVRVCGAMLVTTAGEDQLVYSIKWRNKASKEFYIEARIDTKE